MASQTDVFRHCLQDGASAAKPALGRCIDQAIAALQRAESQAPKMADRDELASAWRQLQASKAGWLASYPVQLMAAFNDSAQVAALAAITSAHNPAQNPARSSPSTPSRSNGSNPSGMGTFSLVDDAEVAHAIASGRLLQQILPRVEQELAELDSLISTAQGLVNVRPELNPMRPEIFTRVLQELITAGGTDPTITGHWVRLMAGPLGREIKVIYESSIQLLEHAHVQAATYRVLQTPASGMGLASGQGKAGNATGQGRNDGDGSGVIHDPVTGSAKQPSQYADLSNYEIRDELFQDFLFHGGSNAHHGLADSYYATVEKELADLKAAPDSAAPPLGDSSPGGIDDTAHGVRDAGGSRRTSPSQYRELPAVDRPPRFVDVLSQLSSQVWGAYGRSHERAIVRTQLKKEATKVGQVLGLEVVRKLVNQVAQDPRLLVPVREAIVALEPSLLRLAMVDPRFFSDEGHPGRRLMERVAQRSFKYNDEFSADFLAFFQLVTRSFNELNALSIEDARPFGMALAALEHGWDEQDQHEQKNRRTVVQTLRFAEERQERADQIAFDLSARSDLENVPGVVLDFLFGPWALAMAHAKLSDQRNQIDPEGFGSVVPDLLWSVKKEVTLRRPAKLIEMIPKLLDKLNAGLTMLGQDPKENEKFIEALMQLHQPVLKLRRMKSKRDAAESGMAPLDAPEATDIDELPATPEQRRAKAAEQPWLGRDDLDAAGFEDTLPTSPGELAEIEELMARALSPVPPLSEALLTEASVEPATGLTDSEQGALVEATGIRGNDSANAILTETSASVPFEAAPAETSPAIDASENLARSKAQAEATLMSLSTGNWVDLYSKRRWLRAQLIWASTKGTLFMFLSHGGQPHSMTKRSCEKLIMQRLLRPVDTQGVVAQALDALADEAAVKAEVPTHIKQHEPETV